MTKAMYNKFINAVNEFKSVMPDRYVNNYKFRHYGKYYRIEEDENKFSIYLVNPHDIHDTLIETVTKSIEKEV